MQITVTRQERKRCGITARRDDGVTVSVPDYGRKRRLPHELAHYAVEGVLALDHGFWGRVASGAVFPGMQWLDGRRKPHASERSRSLVKTDPEAVEAERLVSAFEKIIDGRLDRDFARVDKFLKDAVHLGSRKARSLSHDGVAGVCRAWRELQSQWDAMRVGESLALTWPMRHDPSPAKREREGPTRKRARVRVAS